MCAKITTRKSHRPYNAPKLEEKYIIKTNLKTQLIPKYWGKCEGGAKGEWEKQQQSIN